MALTRKLLKGMGLNDEQMDTIIEAHMDTVDGLKAEVSKYKGDAEKLPGVQKELDALKAVGDGGWENRAKDWEKKYNDLVADNTKKETQAAKETAVRAYFESKNIKGANLNIAMRSSAAEISAVELENGNIKDTSALDSLIAGDYAGLVSNTNTPVVRVDMNARLNNKDKPVSKEDILSIKDGAARRQAMLDNPSLFGLGESK